jgi:hypothetical protein
MLDGTMLAGSAANALLSSSTGRTSSIASRARPLPGLG